MRLNLHHTLFPRHDYVPDHAEPVPAATVLQRLDEAVALPWRAKKRPTMVTTKGDEMKLASLLIAF